MTNQGSGAFQPQAPFALGDQGASSLVLADLDADGWLDVAASSTGPSGLLVHINSGGMFGGIGQSFRTGGLPVHLVATDLDGDGAADVVTTNNSSGTISVHLNAAAGSPCSIASYCTAKPNSLGSLARALGTGVPALGAAGYSLHLADAVPGNVAIAIFGMNGPAATPFANGTLCLQPPVQRLPVQSITPVGSASVAIGVGKSLVGTSRWYQWWYRDPTHPDGTGQALSDGLAVTFCD